MQGTAGGPKQEKNCGRAPNNYRTAGAPKEPGTAGGPKQEESRGRAQRRREPREGPNKKRTAGEPQTRIELRERPRKQELREGPNKKRTAGGPKQEENRGRAQTSRIPGGGRGRTGMGMRRSWLAKPVARKTSPMAAPLERKPPAVPALTTRSGRNSCAAR
jgi:hypothetical protein